MPKQLSVVGGGLAGSEAAWQAAERGVDVVLYEMRPARSTPAHVTDRLAELVCSNSLGSDKPDTAAGLLKAELRRLGSLILTSAEKCAVPAGAALAVDRERFAETVTEAITSHPRIRLVREEVRKLPDGVVVVASGPLTSEAFAGELARLTGEDHLYFYDALAPIVAAESIDMSVAFRGSRYGHQRPMDGEAAEGDYINCPLTRDEYHAFIDALGAAETYPLREFERDIQQAGVKAGPERFFEGCLPVEILAARGPDALAFGPMKPVGLVDPRSGRRPWAVVQLRQDDLAASLYNLVGFQTNLRQAEQKRVFRMVPGLERAEFVRYGQMHRNTFVNAPRLLHATLEFRPWPGGTDPWPVLFFAGQITGVEGYMGNAATGLLAGINAARRLQGQPPWLLPRTTMLGALLWYVSHAAPESFQPMKANFGLLPMLEPPVRRKRQRYARYASRALEDLEGFLAAPTRPGPSP